MDYSKVTLSNTGTKPHKNVSIEICGVNYRVGELKPKDKKEIKFKATKDSSYKIESYKNDYDGMICSLGKIRKGITQKDTIEFRDQLISLQPFNHSPLKKVKVLEKGIS